MCNTTTTIEIDNRQIRIDKCMANIILFLNEKGIKTLACCCGHNIYIPSIVIQENNNTIREIFSGKIINRNKNFYKEDRRGFSYIPECLI